ncbi:MAG: cation:proton antiporter [Candidatus Aenigmarchaeota archaeon]|nr:cation:proton antiporter [Candidatus Aenigmarchaeota archaeon]
MVHADPYLFGFVMITLAALVIGLIMGFMRQPSVIAYLLAGVLVGPYGLKLISEGSMISGLGNLGVMLLLFFVGASISLSTLVKRWKLAIFGTLIQIILSLGVVFLIGHIFSWPLGQMVLMGFVISLSSTAVIVKILESREEIGTKLGQDVIGILVMQDLAVIPMIMILSALSGEATNVTGLLLNLAGGIFVIVLVLSIVRNGFLKLPFGKRIESDPELQVLAALAMCFGIAVLSESFQLSAAFGAFIAGMSISSVREMKWITQNLQPFKVLFIALFFISIGMMVDLEYLSAHAFELGLLLLALFFVNSILNAFIFRWSGESWRNSLYGGSYLAQIGEFSFVLIAMGLGLGLISSSAYQLTLQLIALSLIISPFWISFFRQFVDKSTLIREAIHSGEGRREGIQFIKHLVDANKLQVIVDEQRMERRVRRLQTWVDKLTFTRIFALWFFVIFSFGLIYFYGQTPENSLIYQNGGSVNNLMDTIYFSFISATTTGYGDILPFGLFKILAIIEVVCGWLLLAAVTTRLISVKQDIIIGELYKASLRSEISGLRTALRLFRQNIDDFIIRMEEGALKKRSLNDLSRYLASFEENLLRVKLIIPKDNEDGFRTAPEEEDLEILVNSAMNSFEKLLELINTNHRETLDWRTESAMNRIKVSVQIGEDIFKLADRSGFFKPEFMKGLNERRESIISEIRSKVGHRPK